jgi:hypothetical protein
MPVLSVLLEQQAVLIAQQDIFHIPCLLNAQYVMQAPILMLVLVNASFALRTRTATPVQVHVNHAIKATFLDKALRPAVPACSSYSYVSHIVYRNQLSMWRIDR